VPARCEQHVAWCEQVTARREQVLPRSEQVQARSKWRCVVREGGGGTGGAARAPAGVNERYAREV